MKDNQYGGNRRAREQLAITAELFDALREVNLNSSWKNGSSKLAKNRTAGLRTDNQPQNVMTEQDLDQLFVHSKPKLKLKTEAPDHPLLSRPTHRDLTRIRFLQLEDHYDKMLTGLPDFSHDPCKENYWAEDGDLTAKFKRDYMVGKVIGEGAYASVRVAVYRPDSRKIAIKAYEKTKIRQPQRKRTVRRQIKILQLVDHPNIVRIYEVVETNNHVNIIMEYLPGISLGASLKQQPAHKLPESACRHVLRQLARALKYLHDRSIAHRDIKLENVILDEQLTPKLIDFGFSTCIEPNKKIKLFCGTPSYMSPEIVQKKEYRGETADVWALGVMLFVMLTGYFPYKGATDEELYRKINNADYPKHDLNKLAAHLLARIFTLEPEQRITAEAILAHPWLTETPQDFNKKQKVEHYELKRLLNSSKESKEREASHLRTEEKSKRKQQPQPQPPPRQKQRTGNLSNEKQYGLKAEKPFLRTAKDLTNKFGNTMTRTTKFDRTLTNGIKEDAEQQKKNYREQLKIVELLRSELRKRSQEKTKCKSHRM